MKKIHPSRNSRNRGSAIVEGVVALSLVIGGSVIGVLLLVNVGSSMYLKNKVAFVSEQAAKYAASEKDTTKRDNFNRDLVKQMGLNPWTTIRISNTQLGGQDGVSATVGSSIDTIGVANWLPQTVNMSDTAVATASSGLQIEGYLMTSVGPNSSNSANSGGYFQQGALSVPLVKLPAPAVMGSGKPTYVPVPSSAPGGPLPIGNPTGWVKNQ